MQLGFDTESLTLAKAALLVYAMYMSRNENSSLSGYETWDRCASYIRGATESAITVGEFTQEFCGMAGVTSIKPAHLKTDGLVKIDDNGTLAQVEGMYNYQLDLFENPEVLDALRRETQLIILLVRDKIQRNKEVFSDET